MDSQAGEATFDVGGVRRARPFRIQRLGHFGLNVQSVKQSLRFYRDLLGFRGADPLDFGPRLTPEQREQVGDETVGWFLRHGGDHHSFVLFPRKAYGLLGRTPPPHPDITINQITWQVGSLAEVVAAQAWLQDGRAPVHRSGRDAPGSNWHVYPADPEGHVNELYYGIEQIGWDGRSKPMALHKVRYTAPPALPHCSEQAEVDAAVARGIDLASGTRGGETLPEIHDVGGILLGRPFKIVRVGPVRLFVRDMARAEAFYRDRMGLRVTEEISWQGHRCVFLRCGADHHMLALYPLALREKLGLSAHSTLFALGVQVADYRQLRAAREFLAERGVRLAQPPADLFPGLGPSFLAFDPDGHAVQFYWGMEQIGWDGRPRPADQRPAIATDWPQSVAEEGDLGSGEVYPGPWG